MDSHRRGWRAYILRGASVRASPGDQFAFHQRQERLPRPRMRFVTQRMCPSVAANCFPSKAGALSRATDTIRPGTHTAPGPRRFAFHQKQPSLPRSRMRFEREQVCHPACANCSGLGANCLELRPPLFWSLAPEAILAQLLRSLKPLRRRRAMVHHLPRNFFPPARIL